MYLKLNRPTIEIKTLKKLKSEDIFFKVLFVGLGEQKLKARTVGLKPSKLDMSCVNRLLWIVGIGPDLHIG